MLSDTDLRKAYDKFGKDHAKPSEGFADPAEFFTSIFGGESFVDWIGEISLMKDLTATMDITMQEEMEQQEAAQASEAEGAAAAAAASAPGESSKHEEAFPGDEKPKADATHAQAPPPTVVVEDDKAYEAGFDEKKPTSPPPRYEAKSPAPSTGSHSRTQIPLRPALMDKSHSESENDMTEEGLKNKEKKRAGMTKEQREKLAEYERERAKAREERVKVLTDKLLDRLSVWTETDKGNDVTKAFQEKMRLEVENLKMESFGIDILHAIGQTYVSKASGLLRSQKFLGIGGFFSRLRDKGTLVKDTWNTISSAIDAQQTMENMAKMEEKGGEDWTDERRVEYERHVTGKILTAAWRGSKFEIQSVLREVCDNVIYDKKTPLSKRLERAQALVLIGDIFNRVSFHTPNMQSVPPLTRTRLLAPPKKKATISSLSNSSPKPQSRRTSTRTASTTIRRTRSRPSLPPPPSPQLPKHPTSPRHRRPAYKERKQQRHHNQSHHIISHLRLRTYPSSLSPIHSTIPPIL